MNHLPSSINAHTNLKLVHTQANYLARQNWNTSRRPKADTIATEKLEKHTVYTVTQFYAAI